MMSLSSRRDATGRFVAVAIAPTKTCRDCLVEQPRENFPTYRGYANARCRPCYNAYYRAIQAKRRDKRAAAYAENREAVSVQHKQWRDDNAEHMRVKSFIVGCRLRGIEPDEIAVAYAAALVRDPCTYCGTTDDVGIDHMLPMCRGGSSEWPNLSACCTACNRAKYTRTPEEFRALA